MKHKNDQQVDDNRIHFQASDKKMQNANVHLIGKTAIICFTILLALFILRYNNPSLASLITIIVGNGNGDNNSGNNYDDHSVAASEPLIESEQPVESEPPVVSDPPASSDPPVVSDPPESSDPPEGCGETKYRVVPCEGLRLRKGRSTASDILALLPCNCEVISEGCADERGWMPVRAKLPCGKYHHGYVFAAYIDPI